MILDEFGTQPWQMNNYTPDELTGLLRYLEQKLKDRKRG